MKKIMAVYDEDPFYAERLSDYINRREDGIFSARAFTSRKRLEEFARDHGIDVLLTGTLSEGGFPASRRSSGFFSQRRKSGQGREAGMGSINTSPATISCGR